VLKGECMDRKGDGVGVNSVGLEIEKGDLKSDRSLSRLLFTVDEAAKILNIKISRLRMAIFRREINYVKLGALVRLREEDIKSFINKNLVLVCAF
jgi:excisionase family DNA binding protein